jgi:hypothetical protein
MDRVASTSYAGSDQQRADDVTIASSTATAAERSAAMSRREPAHVGGAVIADIAVQGRAPAASTTATTGNGDVVDLAAAILAKAPLSEAQARLYAAVHVVANGVAYGARVVDGTLLDLMDPRVENEPYVVPITDTAAASTDELAVMRKQMAELQAAFAAQPKAPPADAVHAPGAGN